MNKKMSFLSFLLLISFSSPAMMKSVLKMSQEKLYNVRNLSVYHCRYQEGSFLSKALRVVGLCAVVQYEIKNSQQLEQLDTKINMLMQDVARLQNKKE